MAQLLKEADHDEYTRIQVIFMVFILIKLELISFRCR